MMMFIKGNTIRVFDTVLIRDIIFTIFTCGEANYRATHQVSDYILLTLIWEFHHVAYLVHAMPTLPDLPKK